MNSQVKKYLIISVLAILSVTDAYAAEDEKFKESNSPNISHSGTASAPASEEDLKTRIRQNYSINLFWTNSKLDLNQPYIFAGVNNSGELHEKYLNTAKGWADGNPVAEGGHVIIWYNSTRTTPAAIEATRKELGNYPITLKNTRTSPVISDPNNQQVFSEKTDIWWISDLERIIKSVEETESGSTNCFIFANFNMKPISKAQIFDPKSLTKLTGSGLVMAHNVTPNATNWTCATNAWPNLIPRSTFFENCFFMYSNLGTEHHQIMNACLKYIMIEGSISLAKQRYKDGWKPMRQDVFFLYGKLYSYYVGKIKGYTIGRFVEGNFIEFTQENYLEELSQLSQHVFDYKETQNKILQIPTKDIEAPTTQSGFVGVDLSNVIMFSSKKS